MSKRVIGSGQWKLARYKQEWRDICAILPKYLGDGTNGAVIYYTDGSTEVVGRRLVWVLDDLLAYLCTDKRLLQKQTAQLLQIDGKKRLPLRVENAFTLVPVKGRDRQGMYDSMVGYIVAEYVQDMAVQQQETQKQSIVYMVGAPPLIVLDSMRTLKHSMKLARQLQLAAQGGHGR